MKNINKLTKNDLEALLVDNPDEIAEQLYKLAGSYLRKKKMYPDQDLIQELVIVGLNAIEKFDSERSNFSTYLFLMFKNYIGNKHKKSMAQKNGSGQTEISLYSKVHKNILLIDTLEYDGRNPLEEIIYKEKQKIINEIMELLNPLTIEWLNGAKQSDLAKKAGMSQPKISILIRNDIQKAKRKVFEKWRQE